MIPSEEKPPLFVPQEPGNRKSPARLVGFLKRVGIVVLFQVWGVVTWVTGVKLAYVLTPVPFGSGLEVLLVPIAILPLSVIYLAGSAWLARRKGRPERLWLTTTLGLAVILLWWIVFEVAAT